MKVVVNVRIGDKILGQIDMIAKFSDSNRSEVIRQALTEYIMRYNTKMKMWGIDMKQLMKIIGVKVVYAAPDEKNGIVELTLAPKDVVKQKPISLMDIAMGGTVETVQQAFGQKKFETKIYIGLDEYFKEIKNQPLSDVWVDLTIEKYASEISKEGK